MEPARPPPREAKASVAQVAATIFFGLFAIGKKNTWEKDGVTVTPLQVPAALIAVQRNPHAGPRRRRHDAAVRRRLIRRLQHEHSGRSRIAADL